MTEQDLRDKLKAEVWSQHNAATMEANQQNLNVAQGMTGIGAQIGNPRQTLRERLGSAIRIGEDVKSIARNEGKHILKSEDWSRLAGCAKALMDEPEFQRLRAVGRSEVSYFVTDPDTGVPLKARMDFVAPKWTLDPKTFSQKGKPIDRTVADAIYFEGYYRQAYLYTTCLLYTSYWCWPLLRPVPRTCGIG